MENLKSQIRNLHQSEQGGVSYKTTLLMIMLLRLTCIYTAWQGNVSATLFLSLFQFIIAPYSLFVSFGLAIALAPPIYASHYVSFNLIQASISLASGFVPELIRAVLDLRLEIGPVFVLGFFLYDQLACLYIHCCTPSKTFSLRETLVHVVWGFLNTKTYTLVLLLHMMQAEVTIPVLLWLLDWKLELTLKVSTMVSRRFAHWLELFYTQHRIAHLPKGYERGRTLLY